MEKNMENAMDTGVMYSIGVYRAREALEAPCQMDILTVDQKRDYKSSPEPRAPDLQP